MKFSSILIVTYGRTGSTLLMGILNTIQGVMVRGENMKLCAGLFAAYQALQITKSEHGKTPQDPTQPFFGAECLDEKVFLQDAQMLLKRQLVPADRSDIACWGFKEIRYTPNALRHAGKYRLHEYLDFLSNMMPVPAFIFLTRNHDQVANSAFWKNHKKTEAIAGILQLEDAAKNWASERNDCFWIDYEEMLSGPNRLCEMFDFLGGELDWSAIQKVMSMEHSYAGKPENLRNVARRGQNKQLSNSDDLANTGLAVIINPSSIVEHLNARIMRDERGGKGVMLGGVVVLKKNQSSGSRLVFQAAGKEFAVQWGLPSPGMTKQFPDNTHAHTARFKVDLPIIGNDEEASLFLITETGERHSLAMIGRNSRQQIHNKKKD